MYDKVDSSMNFLDREKEVLKFWKDNDVFPKSIEQNEGKEEFSFYDGPPTANGMPHIGHVLTRVIKDIIPRYKTMKGYHVLRKAGFDTHGLPVELQVEKELGMDGKEEIEAYGIEPFIKKCKESVWKYKNEWIKMSDKVAYWCDMDHPYITYEDDYIESEWWALKTISDKGLLYKGHKIVPYCPRCGTALSSHEVAQGYKDVKEISVFAKFKRVGKEGYFLAWTTTPWTLPSNVALCMNADENYVEIKAEDGQVYVLAEALAPKLFENYETISTKKGKEYEYAEYEPLYNCYNGDKKAFYVVNDPYVTLTDGTGIVHIAPAFGEDDYKVGKKYDLPFVQMVDDKGDMKKETPFAGLFCKDADKLVIKDLYERGLLFKELKFEHSYPFCWRCNTPLLYYARSSWFIKMTDPTVKANLLKNNASVNWMPPTIGTGRMGNFLENVIDWGISRERYWGTPLPIWVCKDCGKIKVIGSREELRKYGNLDHDIELHRPYLDDVKFKCECGGDMYRTPEVLDCWFDSGSMPFAQLHYPFENKELFEAHYPADFISEAVDQTRGWFYTLLAISTILFNKSPFKNCIVLGHVNDKNGIKMSKHIGNVVDPNSVLDVQGADAIRWYFYSSSAPWLPTRFSADNVSESQRKFMGTLWNSYSFFVLYANIDGYDPTKYSLKDCKLSHMDKWILSNLNTIVDTVDKNLDQYKITESTRVLQDFVDVLSNWYIRRGRERYWAKDMTDDKIAAYTTLYTVLVTLAKVLAPFTPFMSESIYRNLVTNFDKNAPISVHLCSYPVADKSMIDKDLEKDMDVVLKAVALGRAVRAKANLKNRQPLAELFILTDAKLADEKMLTLVADELNVKKAEIVSDNAKFMTYELKPQLKTLGPKYGKSLGGIREHLSKVSGTSEANDIVNLVNAGNTYKFNVGDVEIELTKEDILVNPINKAGYALESDNNMTVILDTNLTQDLIDEGISRELTSKIQTMRKEAGFEVTDHIIIGYEGSGKAIDILKKDKTILEVALADGIEDKVEGFIREYDVNGENVKLSVKKK
jgi:isoleucyl-tRNA synthetase